MITDQLALFLLILGGVVLIAIVIVIIFRRKLSYIFMRLQVDAVSGLPTFESLNKYLKNRSKKETLILFLIDIDNFSRFNNQSKSLGDKVLRFFASELKKAVKKYALSMRYRNEDEFLLVVKEKNAIIVEEILIELDNKLSYNGDPLNFCYGISVIECHDFPDFVNATPI